MNCQSCLKHRQAAYYLRIGQSLERRNAGLKAANTRLARQLRRLLEEERRRNAETAR